MSGRSEQSLGQSSRSATRSDLSSPSGLSSRSGSSSRWGGARDEARGRGVGVSFREPVVPVANPSKGKKKALLLCRNNRTGPVIPIPGRKFIWTTYTTIIAATSKNAIIEETITYLPVIVILKSDHYGTDELVARVLAPFQ